MCEMPWPSRRISTGRPSPGARSVSGDWADAVAEEEATTTRQRIRIEACIPQDKETASKASGDRRAVEVPGAKWHEPRSGDSTFSGIQFRGCILGGTTRVSGVTECPTTI